MGIATGIYRVWGLRLTVEDLCFGLRLCLA